MFKKYALRVGLFLFFGGIAIAIVATFGLSVISYVPMGFLVGFFSKLAEKFIVNKIGHNGK